MRLNSRGIQWLLQSRGTASFDQVCTASLGLCHFKTYHDKKMKVNQYYRLKRAERNGRTFVREFSTVKKWLSPPGNLTLTLTLTRQWGTLHQNRAMTELRN